VSFEAAVQTAIFTRLSGYAPLINYGAGVTVRENIKQGTPYPYVTLGEDSFADWSADDFLGAAGSIVVHTWSRADSNLELKAIMGHVYDALARYDLPVTGYTLVTLEYSTSRNFRDADGVTRHGVTEFDLVLSD
jgi:hypothetical protein